MMEFAKFFQVKEISTPSHAARQAGERLKVEPNYRRLLDEVMQKLG
jgi:hypothetical protein